MIVCSMSAKGCGWANAVVESFISTLKMELEQDDVREELITPRQLQRARAFWIEGYDNRERPPSTTRYLSKIGYEQRLITARKLIPR